jgi:hypothetical protein
MASFFDFDFFFIYLTLFSFLFSICLVELIIKSGLEC